MKLFAGVLAICFFIGAIVLLPGLMVISLYDSSVMNTHFVDNFYKVEEYSEEFMEGRVERIINEIHQENEEHHQRRQEQISLREELNEEVEHYNLAFSEYDMASRAVELLTERINELETEIKELEDRKENLQKEMRNCSDEDCATDDLCSDCNDLQTKIDSIRGSLDAKNKEIEERKNERLDFRELKEEAEGEFTQIQDRIDEINKELNQYYIEEDKYHHFEVVGINEELPPGEMLDDVYDSELFNNIMANIDIPFILDVHDYLTKTGEIKTNHQVPLEELQVGANSQTMMMDSEIIFDEVLEHFLKEKEYEEPKIVFGDPGDKPFSEREYSYSREIEVFKEFPEGIDGLDNPEYETYEIEKIPYYETVKTRNYYIDQPINIIEEMVEDQGTTLGEFAYRKWRNSLMNPENAPEEPEDEIYKVHIENLLRRSQTNWITWADGIDELEDFDISHYKEFGDVYYEQYINRGAHSEILLDAVHQFRQYNIPFIPGNELPEEVGINLNELEDYVNVEVPPEYEPVLMEDYMPQIDEDITEGYHFLTPIEEQIWNQLNQYKKDHVFCYDKDKSKIRVEVPGERAAAEMKGELVSPVGLGNTGFLQFVSEYMAEEDSQAGQEFRAEDIKGIYERGILVADETALREGDIVMSANPEIKEDITFGIVEEILSDDNIRINYYNREEREFETTQETDDFHVFIRFFPTEEEVEIFEEETTN